MNNRSALSFGALAAALTEKGQTGGWGGALLSTIPADFLRKSVLVLGGVSAQQVKQKSERIRETGASTVP